MLIKKTYKPGCQQTINSDNYTVSEFTFSVYEQSLQTKEKKSVTTLHAQMHMHQTMMYHYNK